MRSIDLEIPLPKEVQLALDILDQNGFKAYIVGGAVRDFLMGKVPHDFDIASPSTPNQTMRCFPGFNINRSGLKHGTVRVIIHHNPVEITTFRIEGKYSDHRHPDSVGFTTEPEADSRRRDFTINAFYYRNGKVYDFSSGFDDLKSKTIRAIGNPRARFDEDALRILRALRFTAELDFSIDPATARAMAESAHLLFDISEERIESEVLRIAKYPTFYSVIHKYPDIFKAVFKDLSEGFIASLPLEASSDPFANLAGVFYADGISSAQAHPILRELRFSASNSKAIESLLDIDESFTLEDIRDPLRFRLLLLQSDPLNPEVVVRYLKVRDQINLRNIESYEEILSRAEDPELIANIPTSTKDLKVTGNDLKRLGFKSGPSFKSTLSELLLLVNQLKVGSDRDSQLEWLKSKK